MMIKRLLSVRRFGLRILILSLFIFPIALHSEDKEEGLELPEVYIYGTYLGKMKLSPKKDFYPYLSKGDLFPLSREVSPGLRFPPHRKIPGQVRRIENYWVLLDAALGNWWSDRLFLDCGLKDDNRLLSLRFTDFRRRGWEKEHLKNSDFVRVKGRIKKKSYYLSGDIFYNYDETVREDNDPWNSFKTHRGGIAFLTRFDFEPVTLNLSGDFSLNHFFDRYFASMPGTIPPRSISEISQRYYLDYNNPLRYVDIDCLIGTDIAGKNISESGFNCSRTVTSVEFSLKKMFKGMFSVSSGIFLFFDEEGVDVGPLASFKTVIPGLQLFPFIRYFEKKGVNVLSSIYHKNPFIADANEYSVLYEKNITGGFDGKWENLSYIFYYSHKEYENYPCLVWQVGGSYEIEPLETRKDILKIDLGYELQDMSFTFNGSYTPREKIPYEPLSEFELTMQYEEFPKITPFGSLNSKFAIETPADTVDIFSLNGGVESQIFENLALKFEVENMFNRTYEIWNGYTEGGIQFYLSVKYRTVK